MLLYVKNTHQSIQRYGALCWQLHPNVHEKKFLYGTCNFSVSLKLPQKKKIIGAKGGSGHQYFKNGLGDANVQPKPENAASGRSLSSCKKKGLHTFALST